MDKRGIYSQEELVQFYENKRFHGRSGEFVNQKELAIVYKLIQKNLIEKVTVLDSPCGTGRLGHFLESNGINVIGLDYSEAMLRRSKRHRNLPLIRGDMFNIPIKDSSLDCLVSLRFMFHYREVEPIFCQIKRALRDEGTLIFDTFNWSPKANFLFRDRRVFIHTKAKIRALMDNLAMQVVDEVDCFVVSPMLYRLFPLYVAKSLDLLEKKAPLWLLVRSFWCVKKSKHAGSTR
jgi:SAM-dependent methyltransferase